jgi:transcriptional regulator with XRE-family HTH domain
MPTRETPGARGRRLTRKSVRDLVDDLRATRLELGLSQADVARTAGVSRQLMGRLERHELLHPSVAHLGAIAATLGLALRVSAYPFGEPLRDDVQVRLLEAFRRRLHPSITWRSEVPLPIDGDRRAWDAVAIAPDGWTAIEGISRVGAADATIRRVNLKARDDARISRVVLVVADTLRNRRALAAALAIVRADFPLNTREVSAALRRGHSPRLNGIVLERVRARADGVRPQVVHIVGKPVDARRAADLAFVDNPVGGRPPGP